MCYANKLDYANANANVGRKHTAGFESISDFVLLFFWFMHIQVMRIICEIEICKK